VHLRYLNATQYGYSSNKIPFSWPTQPGPNGENNNDGQVWFRVKRWLLTGTRTHFERAFFTIVNEVSEASTDLPDDHTDGMKVTLLLSLFWMKLSWEILPILLFKYWGIHLLAAPTCLPYIWFMRTIFSCSQAI
jgi:hypothetical protein